MSSSTSRITRTMASVVIAAGLAAGVRRASRRQPMPRTWTPATPFSTDAYRGRTPSSA